jgi:hypothetical protein
MKLQDVRRILTESEGCQWSKLDSAGPLYRNGFGTWTTADNQGIDVTWHHSAAVYRDDIDLTVQWGMKLDATRDRGHWAFPWAENFMSKDVTPYWVDVFWRGSLVDRYAAVSVDGAHGLVPMPHTAGEEPNWLDAVTKREAGVIRLIAELGNYGRSFDGYLALAGFTIVDDED